MAPTPDLTPLTLLVDDQEWTSRSIESILRPKGHVVLKAFTGQQAIDLVGKVSPDAVLVDVDLPDIDVGDFLRRLKASPTIHPTTPILAISGSAVGRAQRLEILGAGAWDILTHPVDANELILRLDTFVRVKQEADRVRDEGLTDPGTGLYNVRGLLRRTKEISADASRFERPLTCVAFGATGSDEASEEEPGREAREEAISGPLSDALRRITRISDTIGQLGPNEFIVVAPGTDEKGAVRLADRVLEALDAGTDSEVSMAEAHELLRRLRAGLYTVDMEDPASPEDLLLRATMALRRAQAENDSFRVRAYEA